MFTWPAAPLMVKLEVPADVEAPVEVKVRSPFIATVAELRTAFAVEVALNAVTPVSALLPSVRVPPLAWTLPAKVKEPLPQLALPPVTLIEAIVEELEPA